MWGAIPTSTRHHPIKPFHFNRTSVKLKYNNFLHGSKKYNSLEEVEKLYKECIRYNESFKDFPNDNIDYLDLSVFKEYGFDILIYESKKSNKNKITCYDDWGESNSMETEDNKFIVEEILDMPIQSDLISEDKDADVDTFPMNPVKTITIKKKEQNREIPLDVKIQQYADDLYEQHGYGIEYEKSIFIVELSEKFPGLNDYEKYYNRAKKYHEMGV